MGWVTLDDGQHVMIGAGDQVLATRSAISRAGKTSAAKARTEQAVARARAPKPKPVHGEMKTAHRVGEKKEARLIMHDGSEPPAHVRAAQVSPKWTDVQVSVDPKAEVLIKAKDEKGRGVEVTTKEYEARRDVAKFSKTDELLANDEKIKSEIQVARHNPKTKEEADVSLLMYHQATRVGSDRDTKAAVKAYGATTLEARHVIKDNEGVRLQFIGKKGVAHDHLIRDPELGKMLLARKAAAGSPEARIFKTNDTKVRKFVGERDGGGFTPKELRTGWATRTAIAEVKADPRPSVNMKEHKMRINAVATKVSKVLGNEPAETRDSYIDPRAFLPWRPA